MAFHQFDALKFVVTLLVRIPFCINIAMVIANTCAILAVYKNKLERFFPFVVGTTLVTTIVEGATFVQFTIESFIIEPLKQQNGWSFWAIYLWTTILCVAIYIFVVVVLGERTAPTTQSVTDNSTQIQHNCHCQQLESGEQQMQQRRSADLTPACSRDLPPAYDSVSMTLHRLEESYEMAHSFVSPPPYDDIIRNYHDIGMSETSVSPDSPPAYEETTGL